MLVRSSPNRCYRVAAPGLINVSHGLRLQAKSKAKAAGKVPTNQAAESPQVLAAVEAVSAMDLRRQQLETATVSTPQKRGRGGLHDYKMASNTPDAFTGHFGRATSSPVTPQSNRGGHRLGGHNSAPGAARQFSPRHGFSRARHGVSPAGDSMSQAQPMMYVTVARAPSGPPSLPVCSDSIGGRGRGKRPEVTKVLRSQTGPATGSHSVGRGNSPGGQLNLLINNGPSSPQTPGDCAALYFHFSLSLSLSDSLARNSLPCLHLCLSLLPCLTSLLETHSLPCLQLCVSPSLPLLLSCFLFFSLSPFLTLLSFPLSVLLSLPLF